MKKILLVGLLVLLIFAGCGKQKAETSVPVTTTAVIETTEIPEEPTQQTQVETTTEEPTLPPVAGIDGVTLFDDDFFALVLRDLELSEQGAVMWVAAVNRTDMTVYMRLMDFSVNSFMMENLPTAELAPEEILDMQYTISPEELNRNGIEEITQLQFKLWVYDSKDFQTPDVANGLCRYYPRGKEHAQTYERQPQPTDRVLVDDPRYSVTVTQIDMQKDVTLEIHIENKSEKDLLFIAPYALANGQVIDPLWAYNVSAGKQRNTTITLNEAELKELEAFPVETLQIAIQIGDHEDWSAGVYFHEEFEIELFEEAIEQTEN